MHTESYWTEKEKRAVKAQEHTQKMEEKWAGLINNSVASTKHYFDNAPLLKPLSAYEENPRETKFIITEFDSVSAIINIPETFYGCKSAVLNFASYKHPGGMFIKGSKAQEECLCHESFLYNVLKRFEDSYYARNCKNTNKSLYTNQALYSPEILFESNGEKRLCDVITCAAPNKSAAQKYCGVTEAENYQALDRRIQFLAEITAAEGVEYLIAGAFGCGVFGQEADVVAKLFIKHFEKHPTLKAVEFAVPKTPHLINHIEFAYELDNYEQKKAAESLNTAERIGD